MDVHSLDGGVSAKDVADAINTSFGNALMDGV